MTKHDQPRSRHDGARPATTALPNRPARAVRVIVRQALATLPADCLPLLRPHLECRYCRFEPGGPLGYRQVADAERFYAIRDDGQLRIPAGLLPAVRAELERAGLTVTVEDRRAVDPGAAIDRGFVGAVCGEERALLEAVAAEPRGVIEERGAADVLRHVELLCRSHPRARCLVATPTRAEEGRLGRHLRAALGPRLQPRSIPDWSVKGYVVVATLQMFKYLYCTGWEMILLTDAAAAIAPSYRRALLELPAAKLYALAPLDRAWSARQRLWLHAGCGPILYRPPDCRGEEAEVSVMWCDAPGRRRMGDMAALERKRQAVWHDDSRNGAIAEVAAAIAGGDERALWRHGLFPEGPAWPRDGRGAVRPRRVAVLVESVEHGRELHKRLPDWQLLHWLPAPTRAEQLGHVQRTGFGGGTVLDRVIVTTMFANQLDNVFTEVLIRADGGTTPVGLANFPPRACGDRLPVVLLDLADDFDNEALAASRRRLRDYAGRGW